MGCGSPYVEGKQGLPPECAYSPEIEAARKARPRGVEYRAGDETWGGVGIKERRQCGNLKLAFLPCWPTCFSGRLGLWVPTESLLKLGGRDEWKEGSSEG